MCAARISLAIDRQEILDIVFDGIGKALNVIPWTFMYEQEATIDSGQLGNWLRYDPDEAVKLLQAAGAEGLTLDNSYYAYTKRHSSRARRWCRLSSQRVGITHDRRQGRLHRVQLAVGAAEAARLLHLSLEHQRVRRRTTGSTGRSTRRRRATAGGRTTRRSTPGPRPSSSSSIRRPARSCGSRSGTRTWTRSTGRGSRGGSAWRSTSRGCAVSASRAPRPATTARTTPGAARSPGAGSTRTSRAAASSLRQRDEPEGRPVGRPSCVSGCFDARSAARLHAREACRPTARASRCGSNATGVRVGFQNPTPAKNNR